MTINIWGAGMAGLLAANMLRRHSPVVLEAKDSLPNNHHALLRFRSNAIEQVTGIPFRKVQATKAVFFKECIHNEVTLDMANMYSVKVTGAAVPRSIGSLGTVDRWIAPADFIDQLAVGVDVRFGIKIEQLQCDVPEITPTISTIPMPAVVDNLKLKKVPLFSAKPIYVVRLDLPFDCDIYQTLYYPESHHSYYRASISGATLIIEYMTAPEEVTTEVRQILFEFGLGNMLHKMPADFVLSNFTIHEQRFGKILPVDEKWRREFIRELSRRQNIYSLGRFATWRNILLDDLVNDIKLIDGFIHNNGALYDAVKRGK